MHLYPESKQNWKERNILYAKQACKQEKIKIWARLAHIIAYDI